MLTFQVYLYNSTSSQVAVQDIGLEIGPNGFFEIPSAAKFGELAWVGSDLTGLVTSGDIALVRSASVVPPAASDVFSPADGLRILLGIDSAANVDFHDTIGLDEVDVQGAIVKVVSNTADLVAATKTELEKVATQTKNGMMSAEDKLKMDGIEAGAEVNENADWASNTGDSQILNRPDGDTLVPGFTNKYLDFPTIAEPGAPGAGLMRLYAGSIAGRAMPKWMGPSGIDMAVQAMIAFNKVAWWNPPGNASTVPAVCGMSAYTVLGNPTPRNVATTNLFTRMKRLGFVSGASAGSIVGVRQPASQFTLGNGSGLGGFLKVIRFGVSDQSAVGAARMFIGMAAKTNAPTNVEPSTLTNVIGVGHGASDANMKIFYGGSSAQAPIDIGANFPKNTSNVDAYELMLFAPSTVANTVYYRVTRLNTGHVSEGKLTATNPGTQLPSGNTLLNMTWCYRTNNTAKTSVGLDVMSDYIETDF